jgi:hypothetical protein
VKTRIRLLSICASLGFFAMGCGPGEDLHTAVRPLVLANGQNLNGQNLNGQNLNGQNLNGQNLNGQNLNGPSPDAFTVWTTLEGAVRNYDSVEAVSLEATVFTGRQGSTTLSGMDFAGVRFWALRGDGRWVLLWIREVFPPASGDDVWTYRVDYRDEDRDWAWFSVCHDATGPRPAVPLNGIWDHRQGVSGGGAHWDDPSKFTFACLDNGALAKCVGMGYKPWGTVNGVSLSAHHQACVRLIRGDFCGDGTPYTTDGTLVNLYDGFGLQVDTDAWSMEAEWDQDGARCLNSYNRAPVMPTCLEARMDPNCGAPEHFQLGTLMMNEILPMP